METNRSTIIAEVTGPSGAGKSTLSSAINRGYDGVRAGLTVWGMPTTSLIASVVSSMPDLLRLGYERRGFRKEELKQVIRLDAFHKLLKHRAARDQGRYSTLLLDEGVVFATAKLRADIDLGLRTRRMKYWESKVLDRWSSILDAIVRLDASDELLIHRVRTRSKAHRMKDKPDEVIRDFLKRYRDAYEGVIEELARRGSIRVLRFDTERNDPPSMASEIVGACDAIRKENTWIGASPKVKVNGGQTEQSTAAGR